ncbi:MAG: BrnT family toxin [Nitrospirae bacterium]|nr:BrnT family toxin [Nitrospirota bacterium]
MRFEWDKKKEKKNIKKHGVSFKEAVEIFDDAFLESKLDKRFDYFEERWISVGSTKDGKALIAAHLYLMTESGEDVIRILSARETTKKERKDHEKKRSF